MDGSAFNGLANGIAVLAIFAFVGFCAAVGGFGWLIWFLIHHVRFV